MDRKLFSVIEQSSDLIPTCVHFLQREINLSARDSTAGVHHLSCSLGILKSIKDIHFRNFTNTEWKRYFGKQQNLEGSAGFLDWIDASHTYMYFYSIICFQEYYGTLSETRDGLICFRAYVPRWCTSTTNEEISPGINRPFHQMETNVSAQELLHRVGYKLFSLENNLTQHWTFLDYLELQI